MGSLSDAPNVQTTVDYAVGLSAESQAPADAPGGAERSDRLGRVREVEPRTAGHRGDRRAAAFGDESRRRHVPGGQAALLDEGIEPAVCDVREGEGCRAHRARDADRLANVLGAGRGGRPLSDIESTKSEALPLS